MDGDRFDAWARMLTAVGTRRTVVRGLTGTTLAGVLARLGIEEAAAKRKNPGQTCKKGDKCRRGSKCRGGRCKCKGRKEESGGFCAVRPTCKAFEVECSTNPECCAGSCSHSSGCGKSDRNERCHTSRDCERNLKCKRFRCK